MPQTYKFQVSMPVNDTLPRNRISNTVHFQHVVGSLLDTDLENMCADLVELWQVRYGLGNGEVMCKAYDTDAKPNYPRASVVVNQNTPWIQSTPREVALCLSFAGEHRGNKSERGRIYLDPGAAVGLAQIGLRPDPQHLAWALAWYDLSNESLPDIGGVDWKFGIWSPTYQKFTQSKQAWVNDDWDTMRSRGLRETTRVTSSREG